MTRRRDEGTGNLWSPSKSPGFESSRFNERKQVRLLKTQPPRAERARTTSSNTTEFSFSTGAIYADKDEYISKRLIFTIKAIEFQEKRGFEGADRWSVTASFDDDRPDEIVTLQSNNERDAELWAAAAHIENQGPIPNTVLVKSGKAYYFRKADAKKT